MHSDNEMSLVGVSLLLEGTSCFNQFIGFPRAPTISHSFLSHSLSFHDFYFNSPFSDSHLPSNRLDYRVLIVCAMCVVLIPNSQ